MKKYKINKKIVKLLFYALFFSFLAIFAASESGYIQYYEKEKATLTASEIKRFEEDVKAGKEIDLEEYLKDNNKKYKTRLSSLTSNFSDFISKCVEKGVVGAFKYISQLVEE